MKLVSIVGARPQFIKIAPLLRAFDQYNCVGAVSVENIVVHTGQHYDADMSDIFFEELKIPKPTINLGVGSGAHGLQTGRMLEKVEQVLLELHADLVVVYGDTNSTLAGALAAAKLHVPVTHVEAGLRSFNRRMPEEINRVVTDHLSDLLLAPTPTAMENLHLEGLAQKAIFTGDIMYDALLFNRELTKQFTGTLDEFGLSPAGYGLVTLHRAENTDTPEILRNVVTVLNNIAATLPLVFSLHPRTAKQLTTHFSEWSPHPNLRIVGPLGYFDVLCLVSHARILLTDSGGLQKEAFFLGCPTITLRDETEWVETVEAGANILAGTDYDAILGALSTWETRISAGIPDFSAAVAASFGDGHAADRIRDAILAFHQTG